MNAKSQHPQSSASPDDRLAGRLALPFVGRGSLDPVRGATPLRRGLPASGRPAVRESAGSETRAERGRARFLPSRAAGPWFWPAAGLTEAPPLDPVAAAGPPRSRLALLISPFYPKDSRTSFGKHVLTPALALTSVAATTPPGWEVRLWDENLLQGPPPLDPLPQVVGITVHLTFARRAFALAAWYRQRGAIVVLGGPHLYACADECRSHAEALAVGDGLPLWPRILRDVDAGALRPGATTARVYQADYRTDYRAAPRPRRDLLDRASYLTTTSLIATRGCRNRCGFCLLATEGLVMPWQTREPVDVAAEFAADGQPYGVFIDNNLGADPDYLRRLCAWLQPLEKIWSAAVTLDVTDDPSLIQAMARAGCTGVFVGFETLTDANLRAARKRMPPAADYARRVRVFHDHGIQVNGSFVLGFDHDGPDCFARTCAWIEETRLECATFHILTPYPGTPLFRQLEAEDRLLHRDWARYDTGHVVFRPRRMTPDQLAEGYAWCYRRLFSHASIWRRRPADLGAVPAYLAMSYLYKRTNWLWPWLIRYRLTAAAWRPLVELSRLRQLRWRQRRPWPVAGADVVAAARPAAFQAGGRRFVGAELDRGAEGSPYGIVAR